MDGNPLDGIEYVQMPSGLIVPSDVAEESIRSWRRPVAIDLFAGAGGFSLGVIEAGFRVIAALDNDATSALTYLDNLGAHPMRFHFAEPEDADRMERAIQKLWFPRGGTRRDVHEITVSGSNAQNVLPRDCPGVQHFFFGDVRKFTGTAMLDAIGLSVGEVDLVVGGPPCQGFSTAGRRNVMDPRSSLVFEFARLVCEIKPKTMAMENVPGMVAMVTPDGVPVVDALCRILEDGGFGGYASFLRSVQAQTGAIGLLRGKKTTKKRGKGGGKRY